MVDDRLHDLGHERFVQPQVVLAEVYRPPQHSPHGVAALFVARHDALCYKECRRARVLGHDAHRPVGGLVLAVAAAAQLLHAPDNGSKKVGLVHSALVLKDHRRSLQAHAGVDVLGGQKGA